MNIVTLIFTIFALIAFIVAAFGRPAWRVDLVALGLALLVLGVWVIPGLVALAG